MWLVNNIVQICIYKVRNIKEDEGMQYEVIKYHSPISQIEGLSLNSSILTASGEGSGVKVTTGWFSAEFFGVYLAFPEEPINTVSVMTASEQITLLTLKKSNPLGGSSILYPMILYGDNSS